MLFAFQFYPVCNFGKFINFGLSAVMSESVAKNKVHILCHAHKLYPVTHHSANNGWSQIVSVHMQPSLIIVSVLSPCN